MSDLNSMQTLTITRPDDWHIHLRDGEQLVDTVRDASRYMGRAIIMPNLGTLARCLLLPSYSELNGPKKGRN